MTEAPQVRDLVLEQLLAELEAERFARAVRLLRRRPAATTSTAARERVAYLDDHTEPTP